MISNMQKFPNILQTRSEEIELMVARLVCLWHSLSIHNPGISLFPHLIPGEFTKDVVIKELNLWKYRGPVIQDRGRLTKTEIDDIVQRSDIGDNTKQLEFNKLEYHFIWMRVEPYETVTRVQSGHQPDGSIPRGGHCR